MEINFLQNIEHINIVDIIIFTTIAFFTGILFAILVKSVLNKDKETEFITFALYILWISAAMFILIIIFNMLSVVSFFNINSEKYPLVASVGIMISAFIASASVLKNIHNTNAIEKEKKKNREKERKARLEFYLSDIKKVVINGNKMSSQPEFILVIPLLNETYKNIEKDKEIIGHYSSMKLNNVFFNLRLAIIVANKLPEAKNLRVEMKKQLDLLKEDLDILVKSLNLNLNYDE